MSRYYNILFSLRVTHEFYKSEQCNDLQFVPTAETVRKLKRYGMFINIQEDGFDVVFQAENENRTPFIALESGELLQLVFEFSALNTAFFTITDLPEKKASKKVYYFDNAEEGTTLSLTTMELAPAVSTYAFESGEEHTTLFLLDANGILANSIALTGEEVPQEDEEADPLYGFTAPLDFSSLDSGKFTVQVHGANEVVENKLYVDNRLAAAKPLGLAVFSLSGDTIDYTQETKYTLDLKSAKAKWEYHFTLLKDYKLHAFALSESGADDFYTDYTFDFEWTNADDLTLVEGDTLIFLNDNLVPWYEEPKTDIKLKITKEDTTIELTGLPNPSPLNHRPKVFINV